MLEIRSEHRGHVSLRGRLDASQTKKAEEALAEHDGSLEIDLSELEYISSAGISVLLRTYKRLHSSQGSLTLTNPQPHVRNVFHYAGLEEILGLTPGSDGD